MDLSKEIVHSSAFGVTKKDCIDAMSNDPYMEFIQALGINMKIEDFIQKKSPILFTAMQKDTKTESIKFLLEQSSSLQEYTLLLIYYGLAVTDFEDYQRRKKLENKI
jgi:hypothetical protein